MRVLVVGAGVAGLTLAGQLCRQGRPPVIIERSRPAGDGYAIGLYPLGSCVLHGLGSYGELVKRSLVVERYELADGSGGCCSPWTCRCWPAGRDRCSWSAAATCCGCSRRVAGRLTCARTSRSIRLSSIAARLRSLSMTGRPSNSTPWWAVRHGLANSGHGLRSGSGIRRGVGGVDLVGGRQPVRSRGGA